jgi:hypothetical protein
MAPNEVVQLDDVFGISVKPLLSYTERESVDDEFRSSLHGDKHIVIYGSSKQGKTALRQQHLEDDKCVIVSCSPKTTTDGIYRSVLRQSDIRIETFETNVTEHQIGAQTRIGFKAYIPVFGGGSADAQASTSATSQETLNVEFAGYDLGEAQSIIELLHKANFDKFIVLENYHYLPLETQKLLAFDLKTFHENGIRFIILGIWREANLLLVHNGDLQDRLVEIPVEPWVEDDFYKVIEKGSSTLQVHISDSVCKEFIHEAYGNIGMLQEFLKTYCFICGVEHAQPSKMELSDQTAVIKTKDRKLQDQRGQLYNLLQGIAGKSRTDGDDPLILPYYLTRVLLTAQIDELYKGIGRRELLEKIQALHHRSDKSTIRPGDVSHLLKRLPDIQVDMRPPLLHYDTNQQRLKVVDTRQFFVLANIDRNEMLEEIPHPLHHPDS